MSFKDTKGSVMLEYCIVLSIAVVFLYFSREIFVPGSGFTDNVGKPMVSYFQRVLVGISLPLP